MGMWMAAWAGREHADESGTHVCTNTRTHTLHYGTHNDSVTHIRLHLRVYSVFTSDHINLWQTADSQMDVSGCWP